MTVTQILGAALLLFPFFWFTLVWVAARRENTNLLAVEPDTARQELTPGQWEQPPDLWSVQWEQPFFLQPQNSQLTAEPTR